MVLMQATWNLVLPNIAATELIKITTLSHKDVAGFKQRVSTLVRWGITFLSNGRSERATTRQQLAGRLALEQFGPRVSGTLLRGDRPPLDEAPDREGTPRAGA